MKLNKLNFNCRNAEANATIERISEAFEQSSLTANNNLKNIFAEVNPKNSTFNAAIKRIKAESDLKEKDTIRNDAHHALYYLVYGASFNPDETIQTAAVAVFKVLSHYSNSIIRQNYDTESSLMNSLLNSLAQADLQASIAALNGCAALIARLNTAEEEFEVARLNFQLQQSLEDQLPKASVLKKEVINLINEKLLPFLNGMLVSDEKALFSTFSATVKQIISTTNENTKKRSNSNKEKKESITTEEGAS